MSHQREQVVVEPLLRDLPVGDAIDVDAGELDCIAGRRDPHEVAGVRGARGNPHGDAIVLGD